MTEFMRPTVTIEEVNDTVARFIVEPLERLRLPSWQLHASCSAFVSRRSKGDCNSD